MAWKEGPATASLFHGVTAFGTAIKSLGAVMWRTGPHKFVPGLYMGWGLGANDSANIFGTAVATRVVSYRKAVTLTAIFVMIGAWWQGPLVMDLFKKLSNLSASTAIVAALASALTIHLMTVLGIPASSSQAVVGAVIGIGLLDGTANFRPLGKVVVCWLATPVGAALVAFVLYWIFQRVFQRYVTSIGAFDKVVGLAIIVAGCYGSYALGANSVAKVTGVYYASGMLSGAEAALLGGFAIALGVLTYSRNVMLTVGTKITALDPFSAAISMLAAALTVHFFTFLHVPVSTSQASVGTVAGIGLVKGIQAVSRKTLVECFFGWMGTPVVAGVAAAGFVAIQRAWF